jgi:hypothetical protein
MTKKFIHPFILTVLFAALTACGGDSSSSSGSSGPLTTIIEGTASAPSGMVATLRDPDPLRVALNFLFEPAAAAITGLQPVNGASVELIRVENDGNPMGEVLATTTTSSTGDYTLTLPQGINLAGNLVVRISGVNAQLRAQVVEQAVNIDPTSEFLLREFIAQGTDLEQLKANDVVKIKGQVDAFDLTAGANLADMLQQLDAEVGELVESQVAVINDGVGNAAAVAGAYRANAFGLGLHDSDDESGGTFANDLYTSSFAFSNGGGGTVSVNLDGEESAEALLFGNALSAASLHYETATDELDGNFSGTLTDSGILSIEGAFEEEVNEENAFRYPPAVYNLQQVANRGLFFQVSKEAAVRYGVTSGGDLDPQDRRGDEAFRALEVFARTPTGFTDSDLSGDFGRVYLGTEISGVQAYIGIESETNVVRFAGDGTADVVGGSFHRIGLASSGIGQYNSGDTDVGTDLAVDIATNGDVVSIGGEPEDGFINDTYDFISLANAASASDASFAWFDTTMMVKLPTSPLEITGKRYRLMLLSVFLEGNPAGGSLGILTSQFNTFLTIDSSTQATLSGSTNDVMKLTLSSNLDSNVSTIDETATVDVAANGAAALTLDVEDGSHLLDGFFNQDASLGLFALRFEPDQGDPNELGLAVLVEVPAE